MIKQELFKDKDGRDHVLTWVKTPFMPWILVGMELIPANQKARS